MCKAFQKRQ